MNQYLKMILQKMFEVVGLAFTEDFVKDENWYWKAEWTTEQEDEFRKWLVKYLKDNKDARLFLMTLPRKVWVEKTADEFIWNYGWRIKDE